MRSWPGGHLLRIDPPGCRPILRLASDAFDELQVAVLFGSFTTALILFIVPVTLLGMISPLPSGWRLMIRQGGRSREKSMPISTLGSFHWDILALVAVDPFDRTSVIPFIFLALFCLVALGGIMEGIPVGEECYPWPGCH